MSAPQAIGSALRSIVIVGAGQTGAVAARTLRELGFTGSLTLVGEETHLPYERPPLSKEALNAASAEPAGQLHPAQFYTGLNIVHLPGTLAHTLDTTSRRVILDNDQSLEYDACLIATGGRARQLSLLPESLPTVHTLRTRDDATALGSALVPGTRLAVVGGGFLGLETAWSAKTLGAEVTVLEGSQALLARALPPMLSAWLLERARALGVNVLLDAAVSSAIAPATERAGTTLGLIDGRTVLADQILVAIGLTPETRLAREAGLAICATTHGIAVDADCRSSDPHVWAAGDCASQRPTPQAAAQRVESWQNANTQAAVAAASMLGAARPAVPYPWFWTDQMGCNIQILGLAQPDLAYIVRGDPDPRADIPRFICLGLLDGVPVHGAAINAGGDLRALRPLFERGRPIDPTAFADPAMALKPLIKSCLQPAS